MSKLPSKTLSDQVRRFDKERAGVAAEAGDDLACEGVQAVVVQIVVVTRVEGCPGARRPAQQCLCAQSRVERVVVENQSRERRLRELIRAAERQDVDLVSDAIRIVAPQPLRVYTELVSVHSCAFDKYLNFLILDPSPGNWRRRPGSE